MLGIVSAMETFAGQAYGVGAFAAVGQVLQRGITVSMCCCCGIIWLWRWNETVLVALGQVRPRLSWVLLGLTPQGPQALAIIATTGQ